MKSLRLNKILSLLEKVETIADIGTDHGRIAYEIIDLDLASKVIATELHDISMKKFSKSLRDEYKSKIILRVGDGLSPLEKDEVDTVIIAGMGGNLISGILDRGYDEKFIQKSPYLILQPVQYQNVLREYLYENNFHIIDEDLVYDNAKYYHLIKARKSSERDKIYDDFKYKKFVYNIGTTNIEKKSPIFVKYINREIQKKSEILVNLKTNRITKKAEKLEEYLNFLRRII